LNVNPSKKTYALLAFGSLLATSVNRLGGITPPSVHMMQAQVLGFNPNTGLQESLPPGLTQSPWAMKAKASKDPNLPSLRESLNGPYAEEFWKAMDSEIASLEGKGTWKVVNRSSIPDGTKPVPGTWAQ
jgi:hypothetical protein